MKKRLSILMAIKNGERFLRETLDSLFAEVGEEDEVIAVDDGSIDESARILGGYPLSLFACPAPGGLARARNLLVEKARGEFVTFLDQDDLVVPESFSKRLEFLDLFPEFPAVVGEIADVIDDKGETLGSFEKLSGKSPQGSLLTWDLLQKGQAIPGALWLYLFRAEFLKSMGPFLPQWEALTDQEFLYRVLRKYPIARGNFPVARYRIHGNNHTVFFQNHRIEVNPKVKALGVLLAMQYGLIKK